MKKNDSIHILCKCLNSCNQNCSYCFDKKFHEKNIKLLDKTVILNFISKLFEEFSEINWIWHGGEILLASKEWFEDIMYDINILTNTIPNSRISFSLQSNGSLLDEEWYELFDKYNISYSVSWDGFSNYHSRGYNIDEKWFDKIPSSISVINKYNYNKMIETYQYLSSKNLINVSFNFGFPTEGISFSDIYGDISEDVLVENYKKFLQYYLWNDGPVERTSDSFIWMALGNLGSICQHIDCTGYKFLVINNKEEIWKCDNMNNPYMRLGKIDEYTNFEDFLNNSQNFQFLLRIKNAIFDNCQNCDINWACEKGCLNCQIYESNGKTPYSFHCKLLKEIIPFLFNELYNLKPEEFVKLNVAVKRSLIQMSYLPQYYLDKMIEEEENND